MNVILLSGGSGRRLWPLSDEKRSKQFIQFLHDESSNPESMLQRVYRQILSLEEKSNIVIATSKDQVPLIHSQISNDCLISVEPCRKNTFPAIALACLYMINKTSVNLDDPVIVCPVDAYVNNDFYNILSYMSKLCCSNKTNLVLCGIKPDCVSEKFGYIIPENKNEISKVLSFKEKPKVNEAKKLIKDGALWNCGIFAFKLDYLTQKIKEILNVHTYDELLSSYETFENISFDYAIVEKEHEISVVRYDGVWKDIGTWDSFLSVINDKIIGRGIVSDDSNSVNIINETEIPVLVNGVSNVVVSVTDTGILVSDKSSSETIKEYVDEIVDGAK